MEIKEWLSLITVLGCTLIGSLCLVNTPKKVRDLACESLGCFVMVFVHSFSYFIRSYFLLLLSSFINNKVIIKRVRNQKVCCVYLLPIFDTLRTVGSRTGGKEQIDIQIKAWAGTRKSESKVGTVAEIENTRRRTIATGTTFHWIEATRCSKNTIRNSRDC